MYFYEKIIVKTMKSPIETFTIGKTGKDEGMEKTTKSL